MDFKRLVTTGVFLTAIPLFANGCTDDLCCTDFEVGADLTGVDFNMEGQAAAQFEVLAQASADLAATASGALNDVAVACANIARDMGEDEAKIQAELDKDDAEKVKGICALATAQIKGTLTGGASLKIDFQAPKCDVSVKAKASCDAKCSVDANCDIKAKPPTCEGGKLTGSCSGSCKAEAGASIACKGSCDVAVSGKCTVTQGSVECKGKCDGECKASAEGGTGIQADGTCDGSCTGTCDVVAPNAKCEGTFEGECSGSCTASASAKVECSGGCTGDFEPLKCEGGELKGSCDVDANCSANCDASVSAKAECHPPALTIVANGNASAKIDALISTLKVNLPNILVVVQARGEALGKLAVRVSGSASASVTGGDLSVKATACLIPITEALIGAAASLPATFEASASVVGSVGIK